MSVTELRKARGLLNNLYETQEEFKPRTPIFFFCVLGLLTLLDRLQFFLKITRNALESRYSFTELRIKLCNRAARSSLEKNSVCGSNSGWIEQGVLKMAPSTKLEVSVEMCCSICVEKVEEVANTTPGISQFSIDRWKNLLTITGTPNAILDRKKLVKRLKKATHDKKAEILPPRCPTEPEKPQTPPILMYTLLPNMAPGYLVPWPPSAASSSSPFITNPFYLQHPNWCHFCSGYTDVVCANCGRGSNF